MTLLRLDGLVPLLVPTRDWSDDRSIFSKKKKKGPRSYTLEEMLTLKGLAELVCSG